MIQCTLPQPARNAVSSIFPGIPSSAIPFFINANTLVLLKIILKIVSIYAHSCAQLQAAFVSFRKTMGCNQEMVWSQFSLTCGGVMRGSECDFARM